MRTARSLRSAGGGGGCGRGTYPQVFTTPRTSRGRWWRSDPGEGCSRHGDVGQCHRRQDANGTFDQCALGGAYAGSLLLDFGCSYDASQRRPDADQDRVRRGCGPQRNGIAVGTGSKLLYDVGLTGGAATMFRDLFLFSDRPSTISRSTSCRVGLRELPELVPEPGRSPERPGRPCDELRDPGGDRIGARMPTCSPIHVWGQLDYQTRKADGDVEAGDSRSKRFTGLLGIDTSVGNSAIIGIDSGYVTTIYTTPVRPRSKGNGWQVGAYGVYDPGAFY